MLRVLDRLGPRFAWRASGGASDFAHCSESRQSHKAVSSSCRGRFHARSSTDYPFTSSCSPRPDRQDAVSFRCLAGSTARKGLAPFGVCAFPSARAPTFLSARARSQAPADKNVGAPEKSQMRPFETRRLHARGRSDARKLLSRPWDAGVGEGRARWDGWSPGTWDGWFSSTDRPPTGGTAVPGWRSHPTGCAPRRCWASRP